MRRAVLLRDTTERSTRARALHWDLTNEDVAVLMQRFHVDTAQMARVEATASQLLADVAPAWGLAAPAHAQLLSWAVRLHEIWESRRAADAGDGADFLVLHLPLLDELVVEGEDAEVAAAGAPDRFRGRLVAGRGQRHNAQQEAELDRGCCRKAH